MRRFAFRSIPLLATVLFATVLPLHAGTRSWDFSYVSERIDAEQPPVIWFSEDEDGPYEERVTSAPLSSEGVATVLYLHCLSTGLAQMDVTLTPLGNAGTGASIGYAFTASGGVVGGEGVEFSRAVEAADVVLPLSGDDADPPLVRVERLYELTWTPDVADIGNAGAGIYTCSLEVEVSYV